MDDIALRVAERYITKNELTEVVRKMEGHMIRIEDKLDRIANGPQKSY
jgi:bacterioferritin (cytochrome b1)